MHMTPAGVPHLEVRGEVGQTRDGAPHPLPATDKLVDVVLHPLHAHRMVISQHVKAIGHKPLHCPGVAVQRGAVGQVAVACAPILTQGERGHLCTHAASMAPTAAAAADREYQHQEQQQLAIA
jgi:hypothetical protein